MTAIYATVLKTDRMQLVADRIASKVPAASTGTPLAGRLVIMSASSVVLASIALQATPGVVSGNTLTLLGVPLSAPASQNGIAALAELRNNAGTPIVSGLTVDTANADILVSSTTFVAGLPVTITAGTITHG